MLEVERVTRKRGFLVALEGIDQSGKRTQAQLLARRLRTNGYAASIYRFPDYTTRIGKQLRAYLDGRNQLDYHAIHLLYAANKWERIGEMTKEIKSGCNVIVDRYTGSNLAYGSAHDLALNWLSSLEEGLPKPDMVLVLDISPSISFTRKRKLRDIHEGSLAYLTKVRRAYLRLARKHKWKILNGENSSNNVHLSLWKEVSPILHPDPCYHSRLKF